MNMEVFVGSELRKVHFEYKRIKNIYLSVNSDGSLKIKCPRYINHEEIYNFIKDKEKWILKQLNKPKASTMDQLTGAEGGIATWLGKKYKVRFDESKRNFLSFEDDYLVYYLNDRSKENIDRVFYKYAKKQLAYIIKDRRSEWDNFICLNNGLRLPEISIKYTTSQWGSCIPSKNKISISTRLIHHPISCLDYVLLHEYTHLLVPNHSKEFYRVVSSYMPDYKRYSDVLKERL